MTTKIKIKLTGKDATDMAKSAKVAEAFHEVMHNTPKVVKSTARKFGAKRAHKQEVAIALSKARAAGVKIPGPSGANYVSTDALHVAPGSTPGKPGGSARVPYKAAPGYTTPEDMNVVRPAARTQNRCEAVRQASNLARDRRTNLGRGKPAVPEVGDGA